MFGIYPKSYNEIITILKAFASIEKVIIYGSRAKGTQKEGSDIDLTIFGGLSAEELGRLWQMLDDSFLPYKFDISIYSELRSEELKSHIDRVGKLFYKKED